VTVSWSQYENLAVFDTVHVVDLRTRRMQIEWIWREYCCICLPPPPPWLYSSWRTLATSHICEVSYQETFYRVELLAPRSTPQSGGPVDHT